MHELLLLTVQRIDDDKVYLYAMELNYHNILRIVKSIDRQEESLAWAIGKVTKVDSIKEWSLEKNTFITSGDCLIDTNEYEIKKLIINKVSYPTRVINGKCMDEYKLLRIAKVHEIRVSDNKIAISASVIGSESIIDMEVMDSKWITYWKNVAVDVADIERYKKVMSFYRNYFIAVVKNNGKAFEIAGFVRL